MFIDNCTPKTKSFTYESKPLNVRSRIDFFLISCPLSNHVRKTETRNLIAPDHKSIYLNLEIKKEFKRGPGWWKFNNTLLESVNSCKDLGVHVSRDLSWSNSVMPALKRTRLAASAWRKANWCINCVLMRVMERRERDNS